VSNAQLTNLIIANQERRALRIFLIVGMPNHQPMARNTNQTVL